MQISGRRLGRLLVGTAVIAATGVVAPVAATAAPTGTNGPAQNYLVLFKGLSSPADATAIVRMADYQIPYPRTFIFVARDPVTVTLHLRARQS